MARSVIGSQALPVDGRRIADAIGTATVALIGEASHDTHDPWAV